MSFNASENSHPRPRVSVGLPIYNGEQHGANAISSLLAQTYEDLELVISDNGSTDATESICREFAARDPRVRYYRSEENHGAAWNFNRVFALAHGKYFKWAAHDDMHDERYVQACVSVLDENPDVAFAFPRTRVIDGDGKEIGTTQHHLHSDSTDPVVRFAELSRLDYSCEFMFGLTRSAILRSTQLIAGYADSDRVLLAEIGLHGRYVEVPEYLFLHRQHPMRATRHFKSRQTRSVLMNPALAGKAPFAYTRELFGFAAAVRRAPIKPAQRLRCHARLLGWLAHHATCFGEDYSYALRLTFRPLKRLLFPANGAPGERRSK